MHTSDKHQWHVLTVRNKWILPFAHEQKPDFWQWSKPFVFFYALQHAPSTFCTFHDIWVPCDYLNACCTSYHEDFSNFELSKFWFCGVRNCCEHVHYGGAINSPIAHVRRGPSAVTINILHTKWNNCDIDNEIIRFSHRKINFAFPLIWNIESSPLHFMKKKVSHSICWCLWNQHCTVISPFKTTTANGF